MSPERLSAADAAYPPILRTLPGYTPPAELAVLGDTTLLLTPLVGFFCSRRAPGNVILRAYDWAREARDAGVPVIGGFQSPMERECLDFLLRGTQPVVVCPARGIGGMRLPREWRDAIRRGRLLILSPFADRQRRATVALAAERNRFVAALAERVLIAHAAPGGNLMA
ncbi:MAG: DNA-processing protein DprA, partial [Gemmatimonadetes bacterium]|nr:DNA-processing protein DprA [Gemmatimonadota bacterium]